MRMADAETHRLIVELAMLQRREAEAVSRMESSFRLTAATQKRIHVKDVQLRDSSQTIQQLHSQLALTSTKYDQEILAMSYAAERKQDSLVENICALQAQNRAMRKKVARLQESNDELRQFCKTVKDRLTLRDKGIVKDAVRWLMLELEAEGVPSSRVGRVLHIFLKYMSTAVPGVQDQKEISARTASRVLMEGFAMQEAQNGYDILTSMGFTIGSDSTSIRKLDHVSTSLSMYRPRSYSDPNSEMVPTVRSGNVWPLANHKSETQFKHTVGLIESWTGSLRKAPLADKTNIAEHSMNSRGAARKVTGIVSDHSSDNGKWNGMMELWATVEGDLGIAEQYFCSMPAALSQPRRDGMLLRLIRENGGVRAWDELGGDKRKDLIQQGYKDLLATLVPEALEAMEDEIRIEGHPRIYIFSGCAMHKELNAVKGGIKAMEQAWAKLGTSPCVLFNKSNEAVVDSIRNGNELTEVELEAILKSRGGAVKLLALMGCLLNNRDDKKGYKQLFRSWWMEQTGILKTFPDTSNTRYGSYLAAAADVFLHLELYQKFMDYLRHFKSAPLNHLKENILKGLKDAPTHTEMAVMALYRESISEDYMAKVRGKGITTVNAMDLGPLHQSVDELSGQHIADPDLILAPDSSPIQATLSGRAVWRHANVVNAIHERREKVPFLREMWVAMNEGARNTWRRFSKEYAPDGSIAKLSDKEKMMAFRPGTNCINEGQLGSRRVSDRSRPSERTEVYIAKAAVKNNQLLDFARAQCYTPEATKYFRGEGRLAEARAKNGQRHKAIQKIHDEQVEVSRRKEEAKERDRETELHYYDTVKFVVEEAEVKRLTSEKLKEQLRKWELKGVQVPAGYRSMLKQERLDALLKVIENEKVETAARQAIFEATA